MKVYLKKKKKDKITFNEFPCVHKIQQTKQQSITYLQELQANTLSKAKWIYSSISILAEVLQQ